jgi:hypothetical protein
MDFAGSDLLYINVFQVFKMDSLHIRLNYRPSCLEAAHYTIKGITAFLSLGYRSPNVALYHLCVDIPRGIRFAAVKKANAAAAVFQHAMANLFRNMSDHQMERNAKVLPHPFDDLPQVVSC